MNIYITKLNGMSVMSTEQYLQHMTADTAHLLGIREMGVYRYDTGGESAESRGRRFDGMIAGISAGDLVICQFPTWNRLEFERALVRHIKAYHGRILIFIHSLDVGISEGSPSVMKDMIQLYNEAEVLIVPSYRMKKFLMEHGISSNMKFIVQEMWDYTTQLRTLTQGKLKKEIHFAGNPGGMQFPDRWNYEIPLKIYSDQEYCGSHVQKLGWMPPDRLLMELSKGGFGIEWYGDEHGRQYLAMNNSLKLSTYLAAGIPVIVPRGISNQCMIQENHLGIVADTLEDVVHIVNNMTEQEYHGYTASVEQFAQLLREGFFTRKCLVDAIQMSARKDLYLYSETEEAYAMPDCFFEYTCVNESYKNNLALSWVFRGEAEGFLVYDADSGKLLKEIFHGLEHYAILENCPEETRFIVKAYIRTIKGKMTVAASGAVSLSEQRQRRPAVSLIMPAYNAKEYIARSIDTALAQSFPDLELIIVNDGSTDQTQEVIDWYKERYPQVKAFYKSNGGQASARNMGIEYADGIYIGFMDNDDMIRPDMIARLYGAATKNGCDISITSVYQLMKDGYIEMATYPMIEDEAVTVDMFFEQYRRSLSPVIWNKLYRASLVKGHLFAVGVTYEDDAWTPYVLSYATKVCYINAHLYEYDRTVRNSTGINTSWSKPAEDKYSDHKEFVMFFLRNGNPEKKHLLKQLALGYASAFMGMYAYPKYKELKEEIEKM